MKFRLFTSMLIFLAISIGMSSCASKEESEKAAKEFYDALQAKDYEKAMSLFDDAVFEEEGEEKVKNFLTQKESLGTMKSYRLEPDSKWMERNGRSMVRLLYTVEHEDLTLYEYIIFSKTDDGYKIVSYNYFDNEAMREDYIKTNEED